MLTKNDMSRVIIWALYMLPYKPDADHKRVIRMAREPKPHLARQHKLAVQILQDKRDEILTKRM